MKFVISLLLELSLFVAPAFSQTPFPSAPVTMKRVAETLNDPTDPNFALVNALYRFVYKTDGGTSTRIAFDAQRGLGISITARHTLPNEYSIATNVPRAAIFDLPGSQNRRLNHFHPMLPNGKYDANIALLGQRLYNPEIPAEVVWKGLSYIGPAEDLVIEWAENASPIPSDSQSYALPLASIAPNSTEPVIVFGYPKVDAYDGSEMYYSVGSVLTDAAANAIWAPAAVRYPNLAYSPRVEFVIGARTERGMSGGGVFSTTGAFIGEIVRGGQVASTIVRVDHISRRFNADLSRQTPGFINQMRAALGVLGNSLR